MSLSFKFISLKTKTQYGKPLTITLRYKQSAGVCDMRDEKKKNKTNRGVQRDHLCLIPVCADVIRYSSLEPEPCGVQRRED